MRRNMYKIFTTCILLSLALLSLFAENVTVFKEFNKANWQIVHKSSEETKAKNQSAKNTYEISENAYLDPEKDRLTNINFTIIPDDTVLSEKEMIKKGAELGSQISKEILKPEYTEFEKLLRVHDYLVENYEYFSEALVPKYKLLAPNDTHHTRIPFLNKLAVCGGFSHLNSFAFSEIFIYLNQK